MNGDNPQGTEASGAYENADEAHRRINDLEDAVRMLADEMDIPYEDLPIPLPGVAEEEEDPECRKCGSVNVTEVHNGTAFFCDDCRFVWSPEADD